MYDYRFAEYLAYVLIFAVCVVFGWKIGLIAFIAVLIGGIAWSFMMCLFYPDQTKALLDESYQDVDQEAVFPAIKD